MPPLINTAVVTAAGTVHNASAVGPASGVSGTGALSGPFFIQEQTLQYDYVRVPQGSLSSVVLSLSSSTWTGVHTGSYIIVRSKATYSVRKSGEWFHTSAFTQPQRFTIDSVSADYLGNTYCGIVPSGCVVSSLSGLYLVAGQVFTSQPWYKRRPWVEGRDTENSNTQVGYNYIAYNDNGPPPNWQTGEGASDAEKAWSDFHSTFATDVIDGTNGLTVLPSFPVAPKPGTYSYQQDIAIDVKSGTDLIGSEWAIGGMHGQFGETVNIFQYDWNRHDWS